MKDVSWQERGKRAIRKIRHGWPYLVAGVFVSVLAYLGNIIGLVDQVLSIYDRLLNEGPAPRVSVSSDDKTSQIRHTLATLSGEIDSIIETWPERHSDVEPIVPQVIAIAKKLYPPSASEIQRSVDSGKTKLIAETIQQELKVMLDALLIKDLTEGQ